MAGALWEEGVIDHGLQRSPRDGVTTQNTNFALGCISGCTVLTTREVIMLLCFGEVTQSWGLFWDYSFKRDVASGSPSEGMTVMGPGVLIS